jgi:hypothetical protein
MSLILGSEPSRETPAVKSHNRVSIDAVPSTGIWEWFAKLMEGEEKKAHGGRREEEEEEEGEKGHCFEVFRYISIDNQLSSGVSELSNISKAFAGCRHRVFAEENRSERR